MNAVEIEEAISALAAAPFDADEFPFAFLAAFGNKDTTVKRLRSASANASDVEGGVLQRNNIHMAVCAEGEVRAKLTGLRRSPKTDANKAKFVLATDGILLEAEDLNSGEIITCAFPDFARHFGFFLPLAGISAIKAIKNNPIDIKATGRLNKLYIELLKDNPDWGAEARRHELNQFMARLIFCFFAEDTGIFRDHLFTATINRMTDSHSGNTHEVIAELFRAMNVPTLYEGKPDVRYRKAADIRGWADDFPYVNGGLFAGSTKAPRFSRIARSYLLRAAELDWQVINPDIFGSMIQAVADEGERGELGMHYTSVPNILKVLNPLFLDDLREKLAEAGDSVRKLRALRKRLASIRVFDPACGSGNFLVIAYREMRQIEAEIVRRTGDAPRSNIPLSNFYGIEIKDFACEIARLALLIAEFQCDVRLISQQEAKLNVLPLHKTGNIVCGNALRLDWLEIWPPVEHIGTNAAEAPQDEPTDAPEVETYICGNPPYKGSQSQTDQQKADLQSAFGEHGSSTGSLDYVSGWLIKAKIFISAVGGSAAFVTTNSLNQGRQVGNLWPRLLTDGFAITFAHCSFKWSNLATDKAGVTVSVVGLGRPGKSERRLYVDDSRQIVANISPYLVAGPTIFVAASSETLSNLAQMSFGSMPNDGGALLIDFAEAEAACRRCNVDPEFIRPAVGSEEFINGIERRCIWVTEQNRRCAEANDWLAARFRAVETNRAASSRPATAKLSGVPYRFGEVRQRGDETILVVAKTSSEARSYLPVSLLAQGSIITEAFGIYDAPLWNLSLIASRIHLVWIAAVCGKLETRYRYSNTLGWNTFPLPPLTEKNKADLTRCAEDILLAREVHFPATIAELYDPEAMPQNLREAHERNDETLERIYIGRKFRNDTERLEKLFELYARMAADMPAKKSAGKAA